jgi:hypothetical protein
MKKYKLTPEHKEQLKPWAEKWIANNMSTKAMDENDKEEMRNAIVGLYKSANLEPPPLNRIVFVQSPFVARFAAGFAAAIWYLRKNKNLNTWDATRAATGAATEDATRAATGAATEAATWAATGAATEAATWDATGAATWDATRDATSDATRAATEDATRAATEDATRAATGDATEDATRDATWAATRDATWAATWAATRDATRDATWAATRAATEDATSDATRAATEDATWDATWAATRDAKNNIKQKRNWFNLDISIFVNISAKLKLDKFGLDCVYYSNNFINYGNQYSAYVAFLSFFRHVAKLDIDYSKFEHYENATIHGGVRFMHEKFCIISDRPEILTVDKDNKPHNDNGPFCKYRDGTAMWALHGIRVPQELVETPSEKLDARDWIKEENADWRRIAFQKIGIRKVIEQLGAETIDTYKCPVGGEYELLMIDLGLEIKRPFLKMLNPSINQYHIEGVKPGTKTCREALEFRNGTNETPKELT